MKKIIIRNMDTPQNKEYWTKLEESTFEIDHWPDWKRAGINVAQLRVEPRLLPDSKCLTDIKSGLELLKNADCPNLDAIRFYENLIKELELTNEE